jgi:pseudouridine synthase
MSSTLDPESSEPNIKEPTDTEIEDPIGEETDGEGQTPVGDEEPDAPKEEDPEDEDAGDEASEDEASGDEESGEEDALEKKPRPPAKLERLQKILAQAGIASRRKAEELMAQGRVQVNGKIVTEPGTKADAGRDHIRVDGKLLHGAERHRYFVLNKPKGFVTTVKDPEGRPTVMQFFEKMRERLYPVGRLDYMSEGLLVVTNDGELANKLTKASSGIEKTYLVKVAGKPTEAELDILRAGVAIDRGKPGEGKVRTAPARIRQVRQGDNPWYEVVLIEGRNRELRKMFEEVGHFVEKIRRVGYGPLILDQEPGNLRELDEQELEKLRKAADGKLRTPKAKDVRRRNIEDATPTQTPLVETKTRKPFKPIEAKGEYRPKRSFDSERSPARAPVRPPARSFDKRRTGDRTRPGGPKPATFGRPAGGPPAWKKDQGASAPRERFNAGPASSARPSERPAPRAEFGSRPPAGRSFGAKPAAGRPFAGKPAARKFGAPGAGRKSFAGKPERGEGFSPKPAWLKPGERPFNPRPDASRRPAPPPVEDLGPTRRSRLHIEPVHDSPRDAFRESARPPRSPRPESTRPASSRPGSDRPGSTRPGSSRPGSTRPSSNRPPAANFAARDRGDTSRPFRPDSGRSGAGPSGSGRSDSARPGSSRPFRGEGGLARPFTTSSGKPRAGGARPNNKPGPRSEGQRPERNTGAGWKPKPSFKGPGKPAGVRSSSGGHAGGRPGGGKPSFSKNKSGGKSGFKGKPGGSRGGKRG